MQAAFCAVDRSQVVSRPLCLAPVAAEQRTLKSERLLAGLPEVSVFGVGREPLAGVLEDLRGAGVVPLVGMVTCQEAEGGADGLSVVEHPLLLRVQTQHHLSAQCSTRPVRGKNRQSTI